MFVFFVNNKQQPIVKNDSLILNYKACWRSEMIILSKGQLEEVAISNIYLCYYYIKQTDFIQTMKVSQAGITNLTKQVNRK